VNKQKQLLAQYNANLAEEFHLPEKIATGKDMVISKRTDAVAPSDGEMIDTEVYLKAHPAKSDFSKPLHAHSFSFQEDNFIDGYIREETPLFAQSESPAVNENRAKDPDSAKEVVPNTEYLKPLPSARKESRDNIQIEQLGIVQAIIPDRNDSMLNIARKDSNPMVQREFKNPSRNQSEHSTPERKTSLPEEINRQYSTKKFVSQTTVQLEITNIRVRKIEFSNGPSIFRFVFRAKMSQQILCYFEKGGDEFYQLEQALRQGVPNFTHYVGTLPEMTSFTDVNTSPKQTGTILQKWLTSAMGMCPDHPILLEFISTNLCSAPVLKETFRKSGYLTKKGNYFGGWKNRFYSLDVNTGTVYYSDVSQGEILGSFSLQYAYAVPYIPGNQTSKKDSENPDKPGFVVTEYKKSLFQSPISFEQKNPDGLPLGKVDFRHVFYAESVQDRDSWVRCFSGLITKLRPDDSVAKYLFSQTNPPLIEAETGPGSTESLTRQRSRQSINSFSSFNNEDVQNRTVQAVQEWEKIQKSQSLSRNTDIQLQSHSYPQNTPIQSHNKPLSGVFSSTVPDVSSRSNTKKGDLMSRNTMEEIIVPLKDQNTGKPPKMNERHIPTVHTVDVPSATTLNPPSSISSAPTSATTASHSEPMASPTPEDLPQRSRPRPLGMQGSSPLVSSPKAPSRFVDDQTRCLQQPEPLSLINDIQIGSSVRIPVETKGKRNIFKDWMKRPHNEPPRILKPTFGVSLEEAVRSSRIKEGVEIPAIVYRCIEYLDAKKG
jgi:hypothetical protein